MKIKTQFGPAKVVPVPPRTARFKGSTTIGTQSYLLWREGGKLFATEYP